MGGGEQRLIPWHFRYIFLLFPSLSLSPLSLISPYHLLSVLLAYSPLFTLFLNTNHLVNEKDGERKASMRGISCMNYVVLFPSLSPYPSLYPQFPFPPFLLSLTFPPSLPLVALYQLSLMEVPSLTLTSYSSPSPFPSSLPPLTPTPSPFPSLSPSCRPSTPSLNSRFYG